jgi:hypothetical protein
MDVLVCQSCIGGYPQSHSHKILTVLGLTSWSMVQKAARLPSARPICTVQESCAVCGAQKRGHFWDL